LALADVTLKISQRAIPAHSVDRKNRTSEKKTIKNRAARLEREHHSAVAARNPATKARKMTSLLAAVSAQKCPSAAAQSQLILESWARRRMTNRLAAA
jgi:hypothetical protein